MESDLWIRVLLALFLVIGLMGVLVLIARKYMPSHMLARSNAEKRVVIKETTYIDPKHRLLLIKRDKTEHLLLIGPSNSLVVESNIVSKSGAKKA